MNKDNGEFLGRLSHLLFPHQKSRDSKRRSLASSCARRPRRRDAVFLQPSRELTYGRLAVRGKDSHTDGPC